MLNYETILSSYDDKLTLMQWLKKVEAALQNAAATSFEVVKRGNATIAFKITFADGTTLESGGIVLQQGESVQSGAIVNGHLILTLTNGDRLDCGTLFNGNIDINGNMLVRGDISAQGKISAPAIVESMAGYTAAIGSDSALTLEPLYVGIVKNGNKITFAVSMNVTRTAYAGVRTFVSFGVPKAVNDLLVPFEGNVFDVKAIDFFYDFGSNFEQAKKVSSFASMTKGSGSNPTIFLKANFDGLTNNVKYFVRVECTYLLSNSLA